MNELVFPCMGTTVRLLAELPLEPLRAGIERLAARLTRFDPASELCALNADPRAEALAKAALLSGRRRGREYAAILVGDGGLAEVVERPPVAA